MFASVCVVTVLALSAEPPKLRYVLGDDGVVRTETVDQPTVSSGGTSNHDKPCPMGGKHDWFESYCVKCGAGIVTGQPPAVLVGEDAKLPTARPWQMAYADVHGKVKKGREFKIVAGEDLPGVTRVDDIEGMGETFTDSSGKSFTIKTGVVYRCFLHAGVPSIEPADDADYDKPKPVRDAVKKALGRVEQAVENCLPGRP